MNSRFKFILSSSLLLPGLSYASPCTEGNNSNRTLLKNCRIQSTNDSQSGDELKDIRVCVSSIEKSGGYFGGDLITWYFTHFEITKASSGEKIEYTFDNPDGRHNFRSPLDYSVVDVNGSQFFLESHRTNYPQDSKKGYIDLHFINYDTQTGNLTFKHDKRDGILKGRWNSILEFEAVCQ